MLQVGCQQAWRFLEGSWGEHQATRTQKGSKTTQPRVDWCGQAWILINEYSCFPSFSTGFWCKPLKSCGKSPRDFPNFLSPEASPPKL